MILSPKTETAQKAEKIVLSPAEAFAIASYCFPMLFLDTNANITDVSEKYKSCHGVLSDRTVLRNAVKSGYDLLHGLCRGDETYRNECVFSLELNNFKNGVFFRVDPYGEVVNLLLLTENDDELPAATDLSHCILPDKLPDLLNTGCPSHFRSPLSGVLALHEEEDDISAYEAYLITRGFSERMSRYRAEMFSKIYFDGYADEKSAVHILGLTPSSYALAFTSALHLLDEVTESGVINVAFYGGGGAIHTELSTDAIDLFGISDYDGHACGLISRVKERAETFVRTVLSAAEASLTPEIFVRYGKIKLILTSSGAEYPVMDFKFSDIRKSIDTLFENVCSFFATSEPTLQQEGAEAEE